MAKKNGRDDPPKPQVTENEQMSDIVFILDKMELILQAVSEINKNGRFKTVPADKEHQNSFLKIDRYANLFENFLKNFWSQLKDPTRFGILTVKEDTLDNPEVRQAVDDMAAGKQTKAVEEFLKKYEIVPRDKENQSINQKNQEEMAKKNETTQQAVQEGGQQQPKHRYNESMINWEELKKKEKRQETQTEVMQSVPEALPALIRARKVQKKAADVGFDFPVTADAMRKVYEEVQELEQAVRENGEIEEEFGDILFALVNISRFLKINPEFALTKAIKKFINRFVYIEKYAQNSERELKDLSQEELDMLWERAKNQ